MPRPTHNEREQILSGTRHKLLQAAAEAFAKEGYNGANINRISKAAGYAKGTIYNYFDSKRALMLALIKETARLHADFICQAVRDQNTADKRLEQFFEAGFSFVTENLSPSWVMVNNLYGADAEFKTAMYEAYQPLFQLLAEEILAPGIASGRFGAVDPIETAALLMTIYLGTASQVNEKGQTWLGASQVAEFALRSLRC